MACSAACRAALASGDDSTVAIHWPRAHSRSRVLYMTAGLLLVLVLPCLACLGSPAAGFPCSGDLSRYNRVFEALVARREAATSRAAARCTRARRGRVGPAARAARDGGGAARAADERARLSYRARRDKRSYIIFSICSSCRRQPTGGLLRRRPQKAERHRG